MLETDASTQELNHHGQAHLLVERVKNVGGEGDGGDVTLHGD